METKIIYKSKNGNIPVDKVQMVGEEIASIENKTLDNVYEKAKNKKSSLHDLLTWEDSIAAEKWRKEEIRKIIGAITFEIVEIENNEEKIIIENCRAFESVKIDNNSHNREYIFVIEEIKDKDKRHLLFEEIQNLLIEAKEKMKNYNRLVDYSLDLQGKLFENKN